MKVDFTNYITSLGYQAMVFMGKTPDPVSQQVKVNLRQAKLLIDTLDMIKQKTQGNLDPKEQSLLMDMIHELHLKYLEVAQNGDHSDADE